MGTKGALFVDHQKNYSQLSEFSLLPGGRLALANRNAAPRQDKLSLISMFYILPFFRKLVFIQEF